MCKINPLCFTVDEIRKKYTKKVSGLLPFYALLESSMGKYETNHINKLCVLVTQNRARDNIGVIYLYTLSTLCMKYSLGRQERLVL